MIKILSGKTEYIDRLQAAADSCARFLKQKADLAVSFSFVSTIEIRRVNSQFRGIDNPTDVLSFPNLDLKKPKDLVVPEITIEEYAADSDGDGIFLGDIIICKAIAKKQAAEYGHSEEREICYLFIHGLLHLFGFDHMTDKDKSLMREAEEEMLKNIAKH